MELLKKKPEVLAPRCRALCFVGGVDFRPGNSNPSRVSTKHCAGNLEQGCLARAGGSLQQGDFTAAEVQRDPIDDFQRASRFSKRLLDPFELQDDVIAAHERNASLGSTFEIRQREGAHASNDARAISPPITSVGLLEI